MRTATDIIYAFESSASYDPEPLLDAVKAKVYALNFGDDEFLPAGGFLARTRITI